MLEVVHRLLGGLKRNDRVALIDARDVDATALHYAVRVGDTAFARILLGHDRSWHSKALALALAP